MVLRGITYEAPSYLFLPPFSARPPFYSPRLCSAHPSILFPSSRIDSLLLNFHPPYASFIPPHFSLADLLLFTTSRFLHLLAEPLCSCPHPSSYLPSLSLFTVTPPLCFSPYIFQIFSLLQPHFTVLHPQLHSYQRGTHSLFVCREKNHLKLFSKFFNSRSSDSFSEVVK